MRAETLLDTPPKQVYELVEAQIRYLTLLAEWRSCIESQSLSQKTVRDVGEAVRELTADHGESIDTLILRAYITHTMEHDEADILLPATTKWLAGWIDQHNPALEKVHLSDIECRLFPYLQQAGQSVTERYLLEQLKQHLLIIPQQLERLKQLSKPMTPPEPTPAPVVEEVAMAEFDRDHPNLLLSSANWGKHDLENWFQRRDEQEPMPAVALHTWRKDISLQQTPWDAEAVFHTIADHIGQEGLDELMSWQPIIVSLQSARGDLKKATWRLLPQGLPPFNFDDIALYVMADQIGKRLSLQIHTVLHPEVATAQWLALAIAVKEQQDPDINTFSATGQGVIVDAIEQALGAAGQQGNDYCYVVPSMRESESQ